MLAAQRLPRSCQGHVPGHNLPGRSARARCAGAAAAGRSLGISPACWRSRQKKQEEEEQSGLGWHTIRLTTERPKAPLTRATNSRKASQAGRRWPRQYNWSGVLILAINRLGLFPNFYIPGLEKTKHILVRGVVQSEVRAIGIRALGCCAAGTAIDTHALEPRCDSCAAFRSAYLKAVASAKTQASVQKELDQSKKNLQNTRRREQRAKEKATGRLKEIRSLVRKCPELASSIATAGRKLDIVVCDKKILTDKLVKDIHALSKMESKVPGGQTWNGSFCKEVVANFVMGWKQKMQNKPPGAAGQKSTLPGTHPFGITAEKRR